MGKLYPLESNQATLFNIFDSSSHSESLPTRPYCTDNLTQGIYPRQQRIAITKRYIQLNPPQQQHWLVFDIDRPNSAYAWQDANLPPPFAIVVNEVNTHCHIIYRLESPVCTSDLAHEKPLRYLAAIQRVYTERLQADVNYSGLIAKNPFSQNHWRIIPCVITAKYGLSELAEWVNLTKVPKRCKNASEAVALGRNCAMFDSLRHHAYKSIREYRQGKVDAWKAYILDKASEQNVFNEPLPYNEVKAIAKSIADWVWKRMRHDSEAFKQRQSMRGKKGGIVSGQTRLSKANNLKTSAIVLREQGMSITAIAQALQVSVRSVNTWLNNK